MMQKEPIHFSDGVDLPVGTPVLFAREKKGLGYYGTYLGRADDGELFRVEIDHNKKVISTFWIVEHR
jgi:hypothetical protein